LTPTTTMLLLLLSLLVATATSTPLVKDKPTPVLLWHGMGDTALGMSSIKKIIEDQLPGVYVKSLMVGGNIVQDELSGFLGDANNIVAKVCAEIAADPEFADGYNTVGFSQGGQFLRAVAQRCPSPPMKSLVSIAGQHQGVYGFPRCPGENVYLCDLVRELLNYGAYVGFVQDILIQAQYWHDPLHFDTYTEKSIFLADINNEKEVKNETYAVNLAKLENLVLVKNNQDGMVEPRESEHFEFYAPGQADVIVPLRESPIYLEDRIGLKALDEAGRLHLMAVDGDHLQFGRQWFIDEIVNVFLAN